MRVLNKTFLDYYKSVFVEDKHFRPLTAKKAMMLDEIVGGEGYHKEIYGGEKIFKLIRERKIKIAERTYFEAVFSRLAQDVAAEAKKLLEKLGVSSKQKWVLEFCTGSGSQTYAFAEKGFEVFTVEKDNRILTWTRENLSRLELNGNIKFYNGRLEEFLPKGNCHRIFRGFPERIDLIYADPPWKGNYYKSLRSLFLWEYMDPDGRDIVKRCIDKATIVCLKLPTSMPVEFVYDFAKELGVYTLIVNQELTVGKRVLEEKVVFFSKHLARNSTLLEIKNHVLSIG